MLDQAPLADPLLSSFVTVGQMLEDNVLGLDPLFSDGLAQMINGDTQMLDVINASSIELDNKRWSQLRARNSCFGPRAIIW